MLSDDQIRFVSGLLICVPLSLFLRYFPSPFLRTWFSLAASLALQYWVYGPQMLISVAINLVVYVPLRWGQRSGSGWRVTAVAGTIGVLYQVYKMVYDYKSWRMDIWTLVMCGVCKHSLLGYACQDGADPAIHNTKYKHRVEDRVSQIPSLLEYMSYCSFLPTCIVNTPMDYARFHHYIHQEKQFSNIPLTPSLLAAASNLGVTLIAGAFFAVQILYIPFNYMYEPEFLTFSPAYIYLYSFVAMNLVVAKYILGFKLCTVAIDAAGLSYEGKGEDREAFSGMQSVRAAPLMLSVTPRDKINNWNCQVQEWLRKCVYERSQLARSQAQLLTFAVSAVWHGFYIGEYISFLLFFLNLHMAGLIYKHAKRGGEGLSQLYERFHPVSYLFAWLFIHSLFSHSGIYFTFMELTHSLKVIHALYWLPLWLPFLVIAVFTVLSSRAPRKRD